VVGGSISVWLEDWERSRMGEGGGGEREGRKWAADFVGLLWLSLVLQES